MRKALIISGSVLILLSLTAAGIIFGRLYVLRMAHDSAKTPLIKKVQTLAQPFLGKTKTTKPVSTEFGIVIPAIGVNAPIIANVSGTNANTYYHELKEGVAHMEGTALPNEAGNTVLFGHSSTLPGAKRTPYNEVFLLLDKLEEGDDITVYFDRIAYEYRVNEKREVSEGATEILSQEDEQTLTLITCWPPGTDVRRFVVRARMR